MLTALLLRAQDRALLRAGRAILAARPVHDAAVAFVLAEPFVRGVIARSDEEEWRTLRAVALPRDDRLTEVR